MGFPDSLFFAFELDDSVKMSPKHCSFLSLIFTCLCLTIVNTIDLEGSNRDEIKSVEEYLTMTAKIFSVLGSKKTTQFQIEPGRA